MVVGLVLGNNDADDEAAIPLEPHLRACQLTQAADRIRQAHVSAGTNKGAKAGTAVDEEDEIGQELERLLRERRGNGGGIDARRIFEDASTKAAALLRKSDARQAKNIKAAADAKAAAAVATASGGARGILS